MVHAAQGRTGVSLRRLCPGAMPFGPETNEHDSHAIEVAANVFILSSDDATFVTDQTLAVDGGYTADHRVGFTALIGLE